MNVRRANDLADQLTDERELVVETIRDTLLALREFGVGVPGRAVVIALHRPPPGDVSHAIFRVQNRTAVFDLRGKCGDHGPRCTPLRYASLTRAEFDLALKCGGEIGTGASIHLTLPDQTGHLYRMAAWLADTPIH